MGQLVNAVFAGGGVRGIGHVGAAAVLQQAGYEFPRVAGSSAGAIIASLLAAGYTAAELGDIMATLDYRRFRQEGLLSAMGGLGKAVSLYTTLGVYSTSYLEQWLGELLAARGCHSFGDLAVAGRSPHGCRWRLLVTASDVTDQRLLILPRDLAQFGLVPDDFPVATAVCMSMSIPLYYRPYRLHDALGRVHLVVDGGLLSNYPLWLFDDDNCPTPYPTIGFKLVGGDEPPQLGSLGRHPSLWEYLKLVGRTTLDAADKQHIAEEGGGWARTIAIPVVVQVDGTDKKISSTDFDITDRESRLLYQNGEQAANKFLARWVNRRVALL